MPTLRESAGRWVANVFGLDRTKFFMAGGLGERPYVGRRAAIPNWFYQAPYGQPRNVDITKIRELGNTTFISICVNTIVDDFAQAKWTIVPKEEFKDNYNESHIEELTSFFNTPNDNTETLVDIRRKWGRDLLIIDAAVLVKVFSESSHEGYYDEDEKKYVKKSVEADVKKRIYYTKESKKPGEFKKEIDNPDAEKIFFYPLKPLGTAGRELKEIYCHDGSTFMADGDYTGFVHRWFQYSWTLPFRQPQVFDREEIVYTCKNPRSYDFYGYSNVQALEDIIRTLKEQVLTYQGLMKERGMPAGIISILDVSDADIKRLRAYWQKEVKSKGRKFGVMGRKTEFTPIEVTSKDMEMLAAQQWFMKYVLAIYDLNIPVLTLQGRAPRAGTEALVKRERRKAVIPLLMLFEDEINNNIVPEFGFEDVEFKFDTFDLTDAIQERQMHWGDIDRGLRTINEIREQELGMDAVPWGESPPARGPQMMGMEEGLIQSSVRRPFFEQFRKKALSALKKERKKDAVSKGKKKEKVK